ncbi:hypothetical protein LAZ67_10002532 [Cordylochernes scorpioides]|uniref:Transposase IS30-like HTH domain-containing protein n=1 Tax=Cordylochernes scorpioides TaxID=51811 RepID=A0ABY6L040_9ARAC|nr:hypothetical protein LAZ67_10002532 [Cordylochernes scorpioides]
MFLRKQRRQYSQLTEFERGRVIGLREWGMSLRHIAKILGRDVHCVQLAKYPFLINQEKLTTYVFRALISVVQAVPQRPKNRSFRHPE